MAGQAAAGLRTAEGEAAAVRWLDAEDATMAQVLAWAMEHDLSVALRLVAGLGWWWSLRGRLAGQYQLLREAAERAGRGSDGWWDAQLWLSYTVLFSGDLAAALDHFTVLRDAAAERGPCPALADGLAGRAEYWPTWAGTTRRPTSIAVPSRWPARSATRWGRRSPWGTWPMPPSMPAIWTVRCGWPARPGRSPPESPG